MKINRIRMKPLMLKNNYLKSENAKLVSKIVILEFDVEYLTEKLSNSMHEVEDLKYTLGRFVKGKNTLDSILGIKINFQREGLGYTPPEKSTPQKSKTIPQPSKFVKGTYVHVSQKITPITPPRKIITHAPKKIHEVKKHYNRSMSRVICNYCAKHGHHIANCQIHKNSLNFKCVWIPKHVLKSFANPQGPKTTWVPRTTS